MLTESGSIFVQIGEDNLHLIRGCLDEVFGVQNFCVQMSLKKSSGLGGNLLPAVCDYLLWFAKNKEHVRFTPLFKNKGIGEEVGRYEMLRLDTGEIRRLSSCKSGCAGKAGG